MKIDPLRNIFSFAEDLVNSFNAQKILSQHEIVRVFILDDGNKDRFEKSLKSVKNQTYPYIKIFAVEPKNSIELEKILQTRDGSFIQFLIAGDQMLPDKIFNCVEAMNSNWTPSIIFTDIQNFNEKNLPIEYKIPREIIEFFTNDARILAVKFDQILSELLQKSEIIISGISRGFFRQEIFENANWIRNWLEISSEYNFESSSAFFFTNVMLNRAVHFLREKLIIRGCKKWTRNDFDRYKQICKLIIEQMKG